MVSVPEFGSGDGAEYVIWKIPFEFADMPRKGRLRNVQMQSSLGDRPLPDNGDERLQMLEKHASSYAKSL